MHNFLRFNCVFMSLSSVCVRARACVSELARAFLLIGQIMSFRLREIMLDFK